MKIMVEEKKPLEKTPTKESSPTKKLLILCFVWLLFFITALGLIINIFQPQWQSIIATVRLYTGEQLASLEATTDSEIVTPLPVTEEVIALEPVVVAEATATSGITFIEGLMQAILSATEEAQVASASGNTL